MAIAKTLEEAMLITPQLVADELGELSKTKFHCSNPGADALRKAIDDYRQKNALTPLSNQESHHHDEAKDEAPSCNASCKA